jgi:hypothetical protein
MSLMSKRAKYEEPESGRIIRPTALKDEDPMTQKEVIKHWFDIHFDSADDDLPAPGTPGFYKVRTGEALFAEFGGFVEKRLLEECVSEIEDDSLGCSQWIPRP